MILEKGGGRLIRGLVNGTEGEEVFALCCLFCLGMGGWMGGLLDGRRNL